MRVANAASLALMLQDSAEPSLLFLSARIAMILQMLRTGTNIIKSCKVLAVPENK